MNSTPQLVKLYQFPRMFAIPNLSPFCCKLETWLRIAKIPYEVVDTPDPRKGPRQKLPFIEDGGVRIADTALIIDHLKKTRDVDPDAGLDASQRATATLVQRTLEEHYAFVIAYTHLYWEGGTPHTDSRFDVIPGMVRPMVKRMIHKRVGKLLWSQGILRFSHDEIIESGLRDWRAVLPVMGEPYFFGDRPTTVDATVFGTLATTVFTPVTTPIQDYLRAQPACVAYAERMRAEFFSTLA